MRHGQAVLALLWRCDFDDWDVFADEANPDVPKEDGRDHLSDCAGGAYLLQLLMDRGSQCRLFLRR